MPHFVKDSSQRRETCALMEKLTNSSVARDKFEVAGSTARAYLDSVRRTLTDPRQEQEFYWPIKRPKGFLHRTIFDLLTFALARKGITLARDIHGDGSDRNPGPGSAWLETTTALTLLGKQRLDNLQWCVEDVLKRGVPGDLIETGVWRGGACILIRAILKAHGIRDRKVWLADSFEGLPQPDPVRYPLDRDSTFHEQHSFAVSLDKVRRNFEKYGLLDDQVEFVKGWFCETLPKLARHTWSVIRLDGDMYQSTWEALENLYPGLSTGGFVIIDDFNAVPACREAVLDYRERYGITEDIEKIDWSAVYWRRTQKPGLGAWG